MNRTAFRQQFATADHGTFGNRRFVTTVVGVAAILVAGCAPSSPTASPAPAKPISEVAPPVALTQATFYVAGMNNRLKIL